MRFSYHWRLILSVCGASVATGMLVAGALNPTPSHADVANYVPPTLPTATTIPTATAATTTPTATPRRTATPGPRTTTTLTPTPGPTIAPTVAVAEDPTPTTAPDEEPTPSTATMVSEVDLNVRAGPGADQPVVTAVKAGTEATLLGETQPTPDGAVWVKVRIEQTEGWINRRLLH